MRYFGAALIAVAGLMVSGCTWRIMCSRIKLLRSLLAALELMVSEISVKNCPMDELCVFLEKSSEDSVKTFFSDVYNGMDKLGDKNFIDIWSEAVEKNFSNLKQFEIEELVHLGCILGRYELENQVSSINLCRTRLYEILEKETKDLPEKKKIFYALPSSAAIVLIMILL